MTLLDRPSWHEDAACRAHALRTGERLWWPTEFTDRAGRPASEPAEHRRQRVRAAKAICAGCPVLGRCKAELLPITTRRGFVVAGLEIGQNGTPIELRPRGLRPKSRPTLRRAS